MTINNLIAGLKKSLAARGETSYAPETLMFTGKYSGRYHDYYLRTRDGGATWRVWRPDNSTELTYGDEPMTLKTAKMLVDFDVERRARRATLRKRWAR